MGKEDHAPKNARGDNDVVELREKHRTGEADDFEQTKENYDVGRRGPKRRDNAHGRYGCEHHRPVDYQRDWQQDDGADGQYAGRQL